MREIRARQGVPPKTQIEFSVRTSLESAELLKPMSTYFESMARAKAVGWGPEVNAPAMSANVSLAGMEVFVDLADLIDVEAEIDKKSQELAKLDAMIVGKKKKLENENFVSRAPEAVVEKERASLVEMEEKRSAIEADLDRLEKQ